MVYSGEKKGIQGLIRSSIKYIYMINDLQAFFEATVCTCSDIVKQTAEKRGENTLATDQYLSALLFIVFNHPEGHCFGTLGWRTESKANASHYVCGKKKNREKIWC